MNNGDLQRLVKLLSHPSSDALQQRHLCGIEQLCRQHQKGFFVSELGQIQQILDVTLRLIREGGEHYVEPVCEVLRILSQPLLKRTAADDLRAAAALAPLLKSTCQAFSWQLHPSIQQKAAQVITALATVHGNRPALRGSGSGPGGEGITPSQRLYEEHVKCIHSSGAMSVLVAALATAVNGTPRATSPLPGTCHLSTALSTSCSRVPSRRQQQQQLIGALLQALLAGSYSSRLSEQILAAGGCGPLAQLLQQSAEIGSSCKQLPVALELSWNLLELAPQSAAAALCPCTGHPAAGEGNGSSSRPPTGASGSHAQMLVLSGASSVADGLPVVDQDEAVAAVDQALAVAVAAEEREGGERAASGVLEGGEASTGQWVLEVMMGSLLQLAGELLASAESKQAKELRNDTLVVLNHLSQLPGAAVNLSVNLDLLQPLLAAATTPELQSTHPFISPVGLTLDNLDGEMKAMVWGIVTCGCSSANTSSSSSSSSSEGDCLQQVVNSGLLQVLLMYAEGGGALLGVMGAGLRRFSGEQQQLLQRHAWARLKQLAPLAGQQAFSLVGGFTRCSRVLTSPSSFPQQISSTLQLLSSLVSADAAVAVAVCQQGLLQLVLQQLQDQEEVCTAALQLLVRVCEGGGVECMKALKAASAIPMLLEQCQWWTGQNPSMPSLPALAALLALWSCVLPAAASRAELLAHDGMDVLLTALANGNTTLRPLVLSILADLLADNRSHPFFHDWYLPLPPATTPAAPTTTTTRPAPAGALTSTIGINPDSPAAVAAAAAGASRVSAASLLLSIWREQQQLLGMADGRGVLQNVEAPWQGLLEVKAAQDGGDLALFAGYGYLKPERRELLEQIAAGYTPAQVLDKVYACIQLLGSERLGLLSHADAATLKAVDAHLQLVQGAVWVDMGRQLEEEGVQLTQEDKARLASGIRHAVLVATHVRQMQGELLDQALAAANSQEQALYDARRTSAKAEMAARLFRRHDVKLTLREKLAAKARKEEMLTRSMAHHSGLLGLTQGHGVVDRGSAPGYQDM